MKLKKVDLKKGDVILIHWNSEDVDLGLVEKIDNEFIEYYHLDISRSKNSPFETVLFNSSNSNGCWHSINSELVITKVGDY